MKYPFLILLFLSSLTMMAGPLPGLHSMKLRAEARRGVIMAVVDYTPYKTNPQAIHFRTNGRKCLAPTEDEKTFSVHVNNMQPWSPNHPVLYTVNATMGNESISSVCGDHYLRHDKGHFCLNDTTFLLKGLAEQALPVGEATTEEQWQQFFTEIRGGGFNFVSVSSPSLTSAMLDAADKAGVIVHTREVEVVQKEEVTDKKGKKAAKKKKKKDATPEMPETLADRWGQHPSLCLITPIPGAITAESDLFLKTSLFQPEQAEHTGYLADYSQMADTRGVCLADLSQMTAKDSLDVIIERLLCTEGLGGILFGSREQGQALKPVMILGKSDRNYWDSSMSMLINIHVANNTTQDMRGQKLVWSFSVDKGYHLSDKQSIDDLAGGHRQNLRFEPLTVSEEGEAFSPMSGVFPGNIVALTAKIEGTDIERTWRMKIGYPARIRRMNEASSMRLREWCRRLPGEDDEAYNKRVNQVTKSRQRKLYAYAAANEMSAEDFNNTAFKLKRVKSGDGSYSVTSDKGIEKYKLHAPTPQMAEVLEQIKDGTLEMRNPILAPNNKDELEIVYAEIVNQKTGESFVFDNVDDEALEKLFMDDRYVPEEIREMAEREDSILKVIKQNVVAEAQRQQLITDKTKIDVQAKILTDYDDKGRVLNNYQITFNYNVDAQYSLQEDFGPGRYRIEDSHAALSMLRTITTAFDRDFGRYITPDKRLEIVVTGSADASPIRGVIKYDGCYGNYQNHPYYLGEQENMLSITPESGITENEQLAFMRAQGVSNYLTEHLTATKQMDVNYRYNVELAKGRGSQYRRIKVSFIFVDVFEKENEASPDPSEGGEN